MAKRLALGKSTYRWLIGAVGLALAGLMWAPWVLSGQATRTSFETFRALQTLGLDELTPLRVIWFLLPVALVAVVLAAVALRLTMAAIGLGVVAILIGVAASVVWVAGVAAWGAKAAFIVGIAGLGISFGLVTRRVLS